MILSPTLRMAQRSTASGSYPRLNSDLAAIVLAVAHDFYVTSGWPLVQRLLRRGFVIDVKAKLERSSIPAGIELWRM